MKYPWIEALRNPAVSIAVVLAVRLVSAAPAIAQSMNGVWRSEGYGEVFVVNGTDWKTYQYTTKTCVVATTYTQSPGGGPGREFTVKAAGGGEFFVRTGGTNEHKLIHRGGAASDVRLDRIVRLPTVCDHLTPNTPQGNFEVFAQTYAEQYISLDLRHVDWPSVVAENRSKVTSQTTPGELYDVLLGMIQPFGDDHTNITANSINERYHGFRLGIKRDPLTDFDVTDKLLQGPLQSFCNNQVFWGHIDDSTGYLRIVSFSRFAISGGWEAQIGNLESALDTIFSDKNLKALVIDVRINSGGSDALGLAIASRFAEHEYLAYTKVARADPVNRTKWTVGDTDIVEPSTRPSFYGPVVELIGPSTVSAGETFTQALTGRMPHIIRIGEKTQGDFSDVMGRVLPNGWTFGLPNEVFLTPAGSVRANTGLVLGGTTEIPLVAEGTVFDVTGVPPDIEIPVFAPDDLSEGKDPGLAKAIELLHTEK